MWCAKLTTTKSAETGNSYAVAVGLLPVPPHQGQSTLLASPPRFEITVPVPLQGEHGTGSVFLSSEDAPFSVCELLACLDSGIELGRLLELLLLTILPTDSPFHRSQRSSQPCPQLEAQSGLVDKDLQAIDGLNTCLLSRGDQG